MPNIEVQDTTTTEQTANQQFAPNAAAQLSLADLLEFVKIVDVCSKRGAFEGPELAAVGLLRNRVVEFLKATQPKKEEAPAATEQTAQ